MGGWGALTGARRLLFTYFVLVLLAFTALIYLTVLCFLSAKSEQQLGSLVEAFWPLVAAALHQESALYDTSRAQQAAASAAHLLRSAGSLCSASAALLLLALWASSRIAGHDWSACESRSKARAVQSPLPSFTSSLSQCLRASPSQ